MSILGTSARAIWLGIVQCLCSKYGPAFVLAGTFVLGGSATLYLNQHSSQATTRTPAAQMNTAPSCGPLGTGYLPETNQFYCLPNGS